MLSWATTRRTEKQTEVGKPSFAFGRAVVEVRAGVVAVVPHPGRRAGRWQRPDVELEGAHAAGRVAGDPDGRAGARRRGRRRVGDRSAAGVVAAVVEVRDVRVVRDRVVPVDLELGLDVRPEPGRVARAREVPVERDPRIAGIVLEEVGMAGIGLAGEGRRAAPRGRRRRSSRRRAGGGSSGHLRIGGGSDRRSAAVAGRRPSGARAGRSRTATAGAVRSRTTRRSRGSRSRPGSASRPRARSAATAGRVRTAASGRGAGRARRTRRSPSPRRATPRRRPPIRRRPPAGRAGRCSSPARPRAPSRIRRAEIHVASSSVVTIASSVRTRRNPSADRNGRKTCPVETSTTWVSQSRTPQAFEAAQRPDGLTTTSPRATGDAERLRERRRVDEASAAERRSGSTRTSPPSARHRRVPIAGDDEPGARPGPGRHPDRQLDVGDDGAGRHVAQPDRRSGRPAPARVDATQDVIDRETRLAGGQLGGRSGAAAVDPRSVAALGEPRDVRDRGPGRRVPASAALR